MLLNCSSKDSWEFLGPQGDLTSRSERKSTLNTHWKDWCWSWSSNILATWCKQMTHWKRPWCWERLKAGGEGDNKGWDGWIVSLIQWHELGQTLRYGEGQEGLACCSPWGSQRVGHNLVTEQQELGYGHCPGPSWLLSCRWILILITGQVSSCPKWVWVHI